MEKEEALEYIHWLEDACYYDDEYYSLLLIGLTASTGEGRVENS